MLKFIHISLLVLAISVFSSPLLAADLSAYETQVGVDNRADDVREKALRRALTQVLARVSGEAVSRDKPAMAEALKDPARLVNQYRYRTNAQSALKLWVRFDANAIDAVIRGAGMSTAGGARQGTLVWFVLGRSGGRALLGADDSTGVAERLRGSARARGLQFIFPLLDLQDRALVTETDVWAGFSDKVREASARYPSDSVLVVRAHQPVSTSWDSEWTLLADNKTVEWSTKGQVLSDLLERGTEEVAARLSPGGSSLGSVVTPPDGGVPLIVSGVNGWSDYIRASRFLESLASVERVDVRELSEDQVVFSVIARGSAQGLRREVSGGGVLAPGAAGSELSFRLLR